MADAIVKVTGDKNLSSNCRKFAMQNLHYNVQAKKYISLYEELISNKKYSLKNKEKLHSSYISNTIIDCQSKILFSKIHGLEDNINEFKNIIDIQNEKIRKAERDKYYYFSRLPLIKKPLGLIILFIKILLRK